MPHFYSFSLGFFINYGSRDEDPEDNGITHLIEHMLFKGTSQKSSLDIVKLIEGLGGSFDAYTTKENLIIVTKFLSEHMSRVFDLISEVLLESKIAEDDLRKEKSVVLEEIKSNDDDPSDHVFDLFFRTLFHNHPMGSPIAGTEASIEKLETKKAKRHYRELLKQKMTIAISGNFNYEEIFGLTKAKFSTSTVAQNIRQKPTGYHNSIIIQTRREISQVHLVFGIPSVEYGSPLRYRFSILNTAFGGGMSSRLFQGLREKEGLVYNVQSFIDLYTDCGVTGFYLVCNKKNLKKVAQQLKSIFTDIHKNGFTRAEIELAKTYLSGNLMLSLESSTNRMLRLGREMLYLKKISSIDDIVERIRSINESQINALVSEYLNPRNYTIAAIGPITQKEIEEIFTGIAV